MNNYKTRFVPTLAYELIEKTDYKRKDDLYCILHTIYQKSVRLREKSSLFYSYCEISKAKFMELIGKDANLVDAIKFLKEIGIIDVNDSYSNGKDGFKAFSKSYRIKQEFLSKLEHVKITDKNIIKRINDINNQREKQKVTNLMFAKTSYYKNFQINYDEALKFIMIQTITKLKTLCFNKNIYLNDTQLTEIVLCLGDFKKNRIKFLGCQKEFNNIINTFMVNHNKISYIKDKYFYFSRNETNGRLDTNLTNLPTELRQFLISKETLYNIDIKNSQPFFFYCLLRQDDNIRINHKDELERYGKIVTEGNFYEYLAEEYGNGKDRKFMKTVLFKIFFSKTTSYQPYKEFFGKLFPGIMEFINKTNAEANNTLANKLSTIESTTIISTILPELGKQKIIPFTIHDSFLCKESEVQAILNTFKERITLMYGICPTLTIKTLIDEANESNNDEEEYFDGTIDDLDAEVTEDGFVQPQITILEKKEIDLSFFNFAYYNNTSKN